MRIVKSELQAVAVKPAQYPADDMPEIAFAGIFELYLHQFAFIGIAGDIG